MNTYINSYICTYKDIIKNKNSLSASTYQKININCKKLKKIKDYFSRDLDNSDKGFEPGSISYIGNSKYKFVRSKALQNNLFICDIKKNTFKPIHQKHFKKNNFKINDVLITKDSNVGASGILKNSTKNLCFSGAFLRVPLKKEDKFYVYSFLKSKFYFEQLKFLIPKGSTLSHGKDIIFEAQIPDLHVSDQRRVDLEFLIRLRTLYEQRVKFKSKIIKEIIKHEIENNQKQKKFIFNFPNYKDIYLSKRLDSSTYSYDYKKNNFEIMNYKFGYNDLNSRGYRGIRGSSLEINSIKVRLDSDVYKKNFYKLVIPTNISEYFTVTETNYIGTPVKLKTIRKGDIIFGGEGFSKGRSYVVCDDEENIATNYHGIRIVNNKSNLDDSIFVNCFLSFWRDKGMIDAIGVGGSGGHCSPEYFHMILIPNFKENIKKKIKEIYLSNSEIDLKKIKKKFKDYFFNLGIYELDLLMQKIDQLIKKKQDEILFNKKIN